MTNSFAISINNNKTSNMPIMKKKKKKENCAAKFNIDLHRNRLKWPNECSLAADDGVDVLMHFLNL